MKLGKFEKLDLRTFWKKEDSDFTPWLAKEENIQLLGDTIGIDLEVKRQEDNKSFVKLHSAQPQHWINAAIGRSNFFLSANVNSKEDSISISLNIIGDDAEQNYERLYELGYEKSLKNISPDLLWDKMEGRKMSCVLLKTSGDFTKRNGWPNQHAWFKDNLEKFKKFFRPLVKKV